VTYAAGKRWGSLDFSTKTVIFASVTSAILPDVAYAETQGSVAASATTSYDSNPFLFAGADTETASFRLEMAPRITYDDERSRITLAGTAQHVEYARRYKSAQNFGLDLATKYRVTPLLEVTANAAIGSSISNSDAPLFSPDLQPNPDVDVTLTGTRQRRTNFRVGSGLSYQISALDEIRWGTTANFVRSSGRGALNEYNLVTQNLGYARTVNENLTLGVGVTGSLSDFRYIRFGDAEILSPQIAIEARLSPRIDLQASGGATVTRINVATGKRSATGASGSATLCYTGPRTKSCFYGQRQATPTGFGGLRNLTSLGGSYSWRVSATDSFSAAGNYGYASEPLLGGQRAIKYLYVSGRYERRFRDNLVGFASTGYSDNSDASVPRKASVRASIGLTYRFGANR
jgi:hypothetical protein